MIYASIYFKRKDSGRYLESVNENQYDVKHSAKHNNQSFQSKPFIKADR